MFTSSVTNQRHLFSFLTELPWDAPCLSLKEYKPWLKMDSSAFALPPWPKIRAGSLGFLRRMLHNIPRDRLTVQQIRDHSWFKTSEPDAPVYKDSDLVQGWF